MTTLSAMRCYHHGEREAIGRCVSCHDYFCRECVAELSGRLTCANCMQSDVMIQSSRSWFSKIFTGLNFGFGLFVLWLVFYFLGRFLLTIPDFFHANLIN